MSQIPNPEERWAMIQQGFNPVNPEDIQRFRSGKSPSGAMGQASLLKEDLGGSSFSESELNPEDTGRGIESADYLEVAPRSVRKPTPVRKNTPKQRTVLDEDEDEDDEDDLDFSFGFESSVDPKQLAKQLAVKCFTAQTTHFQNPSYKTRITWLAACEELQKAQNKLKTKKQDLILFNNQLVALEKQYWSKVRNK